MTLINTQQTQAHSLVGWYSDVNNRGLSRLSDHGGMVAMLGG